MMETVNRVMGDYGCKQQRLQAMSGVPVLNFVEIDIIVRRGHC